MNGRYYDRGNEAAPVVEIVAQGNNIALIVREHGIYDITTSDNNPIRSIWHYDVDSKTARLTYKSNKHPLVENDRKHQE